MLVNNNSIICVPTDKLQQNNLKNNSNNKSIYMKSCNLL